jgi:putative transposase
MSWGRSPTCQVRILRRTGHYSVMAFYRRRLPHWQPEGTSIFLTWRLHGSLPGAVSRQALGLTTTEGRRFVVTDRLMARAVSGPTWLKDPRVATCVMEALFTGERQWQLYDLSAWVIMPNHVHVLLDPHKALSEVTRAVKSTSAREANQVLGRRGLPFWQDESYDHWVRDAKEFNRIVHYIESNPVDAGLASRIEDWAWSSASARFFGGQVGDLPHAL